MSTVKFYTLYPMRNATIDDSANIHLDYPAENVLDYNRNSLCKGTGSSAMRIDIDLGTAHSIDGWIADIRNYDLHGINSADRYYSDNGTIYTFFSGGPVLPTTQPVLAQDIGSQGNHRYWRLIFNSGSPNVDLGMIGWCYIRELTYRHQIPSTAGRQSLVTTNRGRGGQIFTNVVSRNGIDRLQRKYFLSTAAELEILINVHKESAELGLPFIMVDADNDPLILQWERDIVWREIDHEVYEATCQFIEVPWIESGELY